VRTSKGEVSRLSKSERHAMRKAVRQTGAITRGEIAGLHEQERRIVLAEIRKRKFTDCIFTDCWYHPRCP
jgi:hypothetical protein